MKKLIALVLAVMMVLSCSVIATAEETATIKFKAAPFTEEGGLGVVEIVAENVGDVTALQFAIEYDETKLELVSYTVNPVLEKYAIVNCVVADEYTAKPGEIFVIWDDTKAAKLDGVIISFTFKAISDTLGDAYIGFMEGEDFVFYDGDYEEVTVDADEESEKVEIDYVHEHNYTDWKVVTEATCTVDGEERLYCSAYKGTCDEYSQTRPIAAKGHKGGEATCEKLAECEVCGESYGDYADHKGGEADCMNPAECEVCGKSYGKVNPQKHTGKTEIRNASGASCTDDGYTGDIYCECGELLEQGTSIEAPGHDWKDADCDTPKTCKVCGETEGDALGHKDENKDHVCDNGCGVAQGEHKDSADDKDHVCDYGCGEVLEDCADSENDDDHNCDVCDKVLGECSDKANDGDHKCDVCGKENITNHVYGDADCDKPATCIECGETSGSALGHIDENKDHKCDRNCGTNLGEHKDSADDEDHVCDYGCGEVLEDCSDKAGDKDHSCDVCGKANVTDHDYDSDVIGATCTEGGYTTHTCSECENSYNSDYTEALGHTGEWKPVEGKEPTCTEDGEESRTCERCGEVETRTVKAKGHKYGAWKVTKPATQYAAGLKQRECSVCGDVQTIVIPKVEKDEPNPGVTIIEPGKNNGNESNPNTGAISAIGFAVLAAMGGAAALLSKKR